MRYPYFSFLVATRLRRDSRGCWILLWTGVPTQWRQDRSVWAGYACRDRETALWIARELRRPERRKRTPHGDPLVRHPGVLASWY